MFQQVSSFADKVTNPENISAAVAAGAFFVTAYMLAQPFMNSDKLASRMKIVATNREELKRKARAAYAKESTIRREDNTPWRKIVSMLDLKKLLEDPNVEQKLLEAGLRGPGPQTVFYFARFSTPIIFFILALVYLLVSGSHMPTMHKVLVALGACVFGFYLPNILVANMGVKRRQSIIRAFPDALDLLLICVEAGMSIEVAFQRVSQEIGSTSIELAEELGITNSELSYLQDRRVAYENFAKRTNHPGVRAVATALIQAEKYGTPLGTALRTMAKENRDLRMTEAEKKAAALPAKLTVPMILFFLPVLFIVILTPAYIRWQNLKDRDHQIEKSDGKDSQEKGKNPTQ